MCIYFHISSLSINFSFRAQQAQRLIHPTPSLKVIHLHESFIGPSQMQRQKSDFVVYAIRRRQRGYLGWPTKGFSSELIFL